MKKQALLILLLFVFNGISFGQDKLILKGNLFKMSHDSILTILFKSGKTPAKGQEVKVYKSLKLKGFSGTMGVANGKVISDLESIIEVQVSLYTSTKVVSGKRVPMLKKGDDVQLKWEGTGNGKSNFDSKYKEALSLKKSKKYKEAIVIYDQLLLERGKHLLSLFDRGYCYFSLRNYEKAISDLSAAIDIKPNYGNAIYVRSYAYAQIKKYDLAILDSQKLLNGNLSTKEKQAITKKIANWKLKSGDKEGACEEITKLKEKLPYDTDIKNFYNKNCAGIKVPEKPTLRLDARVISRSKDGFRITVTIEKKPIECYDGGLKYSKAKVLKVGTIIKSGQCNTKSFMSIAVLKVKSITKGVYTLEVLYWLNSPGDSPWIKRSEIGDIFTVSW